MKRVFEEYGIDLFLDTRRSVLSSNAAVFLVSFLSVLENRWRSQDVFAALKTGLTPLEAGDIEQLELYVQKYHVRGSMWKKPFTKGESEYGPEGMDRLNGFREQAAACFGGLEEVYRRKDQNYRCFVTALWRYMTEELKIPERITEMTEALDREGFPEEADEASQVWNMIGGQLDQVVELIGDTAFDGAEFLELLTAGLQNAEVGVLPSTVDDIMMGTMQRTRTGDRKALLVIDANDGVLPEKPRDDGLLEPVLGGLCGDDAGQPQRLHHPGLLAAGKGPAHDPGRGALQGLGAMGVAQNAGDPGARPGLDAAGLPDGRADRGGARGADSVGLRTARGCAPIRMPHSLRHRVKYI